MKEIRKNSLSTRKITYAALFLALGYLLPSVTMQIPTIGKLLSPMHLPAFLCGFVCGPIWGAVVGAVTPILRSLITSMPPFYPKAVLMAVEIASYGIISGVLYKVLPKKPLYLYLSLAAAMIGGRVIYCSLKMLTLGLDGEAFSPILIFAESFTGASAGIILQLAAVPPLVLLIKKLSGLPEAKDS